MNRTEKDRKQHSGFCTRKDSDQAWQLRGQVRKLVKLELGFSVSVSTAAVLGTGETQ